MDTFKTLAKFDYEGKIYILALVEKKLVFYLSKNKSLSKILNYEDLKTCLDILNSISIRKQTSIFLRNKKIGDNVYQIFYDTTTRLHWWKCINYNKNTNNDSKILMFLYNYSPDIYYLSNKIDSKNGSAIVRKINGKIARIMIVALEFFILIGSITRLKQNIVNLDDEQIATLQDYIEFMVKDKIDDPDEEANKQRIEAEEPFEYDWKQLEQAIEENPFLDYDEKMFIKKYRPIYDRDHKYMDIPMNIERLKTIRFTYFEGEIPFENAEACYIPSLNHFYFAYSHGINDIDERIGYHELKHLMAIYSSGISNEYVTELSTKEDIIKLIELGVITPKREWFDSNRGLLTGMNSGYSGTCKLFYLLLYLVDEDTRFKYVYQTDERDLADALIKIDKTSNLDEAKRRAYNLVLYFDTHQYTHYRGSELDKKMKKDYSEKEIGEALNYYFKLKFGYDIVYDLNSYLATNVEFFGYFNDNKTYPISEAIISSLGIFTDGIDSNKSYDSKLFATSTQPEGLFHSIKPEIYYCENYQNKSKVITPDDCLNYKESLKKLNENIEDKEWRKFNGREFN